MKARGYRKLNFGGIMDWLLVLLVIGLIGYYVKNHPEVLNRAKSPAVIKPTPTPEPPQPAVTPEPTPEATPTPSVPPSATPTPVAISTPTPKTPPDFATIAGTPGLWPRQVALVKPVSFPIVINGKVAGQTQAPAGVALRLVRILPDISNPQVEVEFQTTLAFVPAASTDLAARAMALRDALAARPTPAGVAPIPAPVASVPVMPAASTPSSFPRMGEILNAEVVRQKESHVVDNYDDKNDCVFFKVKLENNTAAQYEDLSASVYTLAESLLDRNKMKVIGNTTFSFSIPPRGRYEKITDKANSGSYDDEYNGSRYGFKYNGWLVRVTDKSGNVIFEKASTSIILKNSEEISKAHSGKPFTRK